MIHLTDENFEKNIFKLDELLLVDFWAEWCGPCKQMEQVLKEVSDIFINKLSFAKLNIDENPNTTKKYEICSIPTLLLFRNSKVIANKIGLFSKGEIIKFIKEYL